MRRYQAVAAVCVGVTLAACGGSTPEPESTPAPADAGGVPAGRVQGDRGHYESVIEMIRGRAPGVEVIEVQPGVIQLRIRGLNQSLQATAEGTPAGQEPLVVIDGHPSSRPAGEVLLALNPNDVGSIQVLKDVSSTAVYGTRGANGVILVTLKRREARSP